MRDRDAAIGRTERLRRGLVTGSVAGSVGIAGALAVAAITGPSSSAATGTATTPTTHRAAHPHLSQAQRLLQRLENLTPGSSGQSGDGGEPSTGAGPGHASTSGS